MVRTGNLITIASAADYLAVSEKHIRRAIASGEIRGYRVGKRAIRVDAAEVDSLARPIPTAG